MAASGDRLAVGAPHVGKRNQPGKHEQQGLVVVYRREGDGFRRQVELEEPDATELQHFGNSVALEGSTLAVSSNRRITVYSELDGAWRESARIQLPPAFGTTLRGATLALGGGRLAIGLHRLDEMGCVLLYEKRGDAWVLERTVTAPDGTKGDWFGYAVALSDKRLVVGTPIAFDRAGAAYVLEF
jgi:hypothetical protein